MNPKEVFLVISCLIFCPEYAICFVCLLHCCILLKCTLDNSKTCLKRTLSKIPKFCFQDKLSLNAGQKNCRMLQGEHSAILSTLIKLPFVIKIFVLSNFERPLKTGLTVHSSGQQTAPKSDLGPYCLQYWRIKCKRRKPHFIT